MLPPLRVDKVVGQNFEPLSVIPSTNIVPKPEPVPNKLIVVPPVDPAPIPVIEPSDNRNPLPKPMLATKPMLPLPPACLSTSGMLTLYIKMTGSQWHQSQHKNQWKPSPYHTNHAKCSNIIGFPDFNWNFTLHDMAINPDTVCITEYCELNESSNGAYWQESNVEKIRWLCNGLSPDSKMLTGINTMWFIHVNKIQKGKKAIYISNVCADHPERPNLQWGWWTVGGNLILYGGYVSTKTVDLTIAKLLINSTISTPEVRGMTMDLKDFTWCLICQSPSSSWFFATWSLTKSWTYITYMIFSTIDTSRWSFRAIYMVYHRLGVLPMTGSVNSWIPKYMCWVLVPLGCGSICIQIWCWHWLWMIFVWYTKCENTEALLKLLQTDYKFSVYWEAKRYIGLNLNLNNNQGFVSISMLGYIE